MAIKVNGTTVIDDNRNLVNIASGAGGVPVETSDPTGSDGQLYYNTSEYELYCFNATKGIWESI